MMYNTLIIENQKKAIDDLRKMLANRDLEDIGYPILVANNYDLGMRLLKANYKKLDIVFLDLDLNDSADGRLNKNDFPNGLKLMKEFILEMRKIDPLFEIPFSVVIVTHYEDLGSIVVNQPILNCICSVVHKSEYLGLSFDQQLDNAFVLVLQKLIETGSFMVNMPKERKRPILPFREILCLEASNNYSIIFTEDGREFISNRSLKSFETDIRESYRFLYRCHDKYIVNITKIVEFHRTKFGSSNPGIKLVNGKWIKVSRPKQNELMNLCKMVRIAPRIQGREL